MIDEKQILSDLKRILSSSRDRTESLQAVADTIRRSGNYRWVGLYDVDHVARVVNVIVWSGPGAPAHPQFPITTGLTGVAVAERRTINAGDVSEDSHYLTAFGTTQSEIIVPIFDRARKNVIGTIDVESELRDAFSAEAGSMLERCADAIATLWQSVDV